MKKIPLLSLICALSFYNYNFTFGELVFKKYLINDAINYAIGLLGIKSCDSYKAIDIKTDAAVKGIYSGYMSYRDIQDLITDYTNAQNAPKAYKPVYMLFGCFNAYSLTDHLKFCWHNLKLFQKANKIAKFNKSIELNLTREKIKQVIWLTFNIMLPYMCYAAKRKFHDNISLKNLLYTDAYTLEDTCALNTESGLVIYGGRIAAGRLENMRCYSLYKKLKKESQRRLKQSY